MRHCKHDKVSSIRSIYVNFLWLLGQKNVNKHVNKRANKQYVSHIRDTGYVTVRADLLRTYVSFVTFMVGGINYIV